MKCPVCSRENQTGAKYCISCGGALSVENNSQVAVSATVFAGFWARLWAFLLDILITLGPLLALGSIVTLFIKSKDAGEVSAIIIDLLWFLVFPIYHWLFTGLKGETPGKRILHIKVVDNQGNSPGLSRSFLREIIGKLISDISYLGYLWIIFDRRKQGFHDKIAGTFAVKYNANAAIQIIKPITANSKIEAASPLPAAPPVAETAPAPEPEKILEEEKPTAGIKQCPSCHQAITLQGLLCPSCGASLYKMAGFFPRVLATFIDWIGIPLLFILGGSFVSWDSLKWTVPLALILDFVLWCFAVARSGNSYGRLWAGIYVIDEKGKIIGLGRALLREAAKLISIIILPLIIGFLWIIWDDRKQGWHDKVMRTYVVKYKGEA